MLRKFIVALFGCVLLLIGNAVEARILPEPQQISTHAWAWIGPYDPPSKANQGFRMNLGFVVGQQAVAVIDSGYSPMMAKEMLQQIRHITSKPIMYVINTNSQPHRHFGNEVFRQAGAKIIAAQEAAARMQENGAQFAATIATTLQVANRTIPVPSRPTQLIESKKSQALDLGAVHLIIHEVGRAHTRGSLVVDVQPDRTVFAGDVLYGDRLLAVLPESNIKSWMIAYQRLRQFNATVFVPGHGQPGALSRFDHSTLAYLTQLKSHMDQAMQHGIEINRAIATFNDTPWQTLANYDALSNRNAYQAYLESQEEGF